MNVQYLVIMTRDLVHNLSCRYEAVSSLSPYDYVFLTRRNELYRCHITWRCLEEVG